PMVSVALAAPAAFGAYATLSVQDAPAASVEPQVLVTGNSTLLLEVLVSPVASAVPELASVIVCAALVAPTSTLPNDSEAGIAETVGLDAGHAAGETRRYEAILSTTAALTQT